MDPSLPETLKLKTSSITDGTLDELFEITSELSRREDDMAVWGEQFLKEIEQKCGELLGDMKTLRREIAEKIGVSVAVLEGLCSRLQVETPTPDEDQGLYHKHAQIEEWISKYKAQIDDKMSEIDVLIEQECSLCSTLGRRPESIDTDPLPMETALIEFEERLQELRAEKTLRLQRKKDVDSMIHFLAYTPQTDFERQACDRDFFPVDSSMVEFDGFYDKLKKEVSALKEEVRNLREEIDQLWNLLCVDLLEREKVKKNAEGCDWKTLMVLRAEKERCSALKLANIENFVTALRADLEEVWKKCHCPHTVKEKFEYFDTDWFNEALLEMHESELKEWQGYYEENQELLKLIEKHRELWKNMIQLEENSVNPDRFKNRGGQLLKEEKERKALLKKIPEIEEEMRRLASEFKTTNGKEFTTYGSTVEEYLRNLYADRENMKMQKLSSRKQKVTPGKPPVSSALKLTPACKRKLLTPAKTPIADKMMKSTVDAKVQADIVDICINVPELKMKPADVKIKSVESKKMKPAGVMSSKQKRLSLERNKRLKKVRAHLRPIGNDGNSEIFSSTLVESPCGSLVFKLSPEGENKIQKAK